MISFVISVLFFFLSILSFLIKLYLYFPKSKILQIGTFAFGEISTKSSPTFLACSIPSSIETYPTFLPILFIKIILLQSIFSLIFKSIFFLISIFFIFYVIHYCSNKFR